MKILVISHMYPNETNKSSGIFVHEQVKAIVKQGHSVHVVSPVPSVPNVLKNRKKKWNQLSEIPYKDEYESITVYYPRYLLLPKLILESLSGKLMFFGIQKTISVLMKHNQYDMIHAHVALPDGYAAMEISKKYNVPLIVTVHGKDFSSSLNRKAPYKSIAKTLIHADNIILVSNKLKVICNEKFPEVSNKKIQVIYNGVNEIFFNRSNSALLEKNEQKLKLLSVSNLIDSKGIDINLKAISILKKKGIDVEYNIVGEGIEEQNLKKLAVELNITKQVNFLGKKNRVEIAYQINECDIFSLPSWNEAFGIAYIEAMASSKPIIGCKGQGIEEIIKHENNGYLVEPKSVSSLVEVLSNIHIERLLLIGDNAYKTVRNNFSWDINASQTLQIYKKNQNS